jgi:hypothetical protein
MNTKKIVKELMKKYSAKFLADMPNHTLGETCVRNRANVWVRKRFGHDPQNTRERDEHTGFEDGYLQCLLDLGLGELAKTNIEMSH